MYYQPCSVCKRRATVIWHQNTVINFVVHISGFSHTEAKTTTATISISRLSIELINYQEYIR